MALPLLSSVMSSNLIFMIFPLRIVLVSDQVTDDKFPTKQRDIEETLRKRVLRACMG